MSESFDWKNWDVREITFDSVKGECRNCGHGEWWHLRNRPACSWRMDEVKLQRAQVGEIIVPKDIAWSMYCPCIHYVPGNNLAYLESLVDE